MRARRGKAGDGGGGGPSRAARCAGGHRIARTRRSRHAGARRIRFLNSLRRGDFMTGIPEGNAYIVVNRAHGRMLTHSAGEIGVPPFPPRTSGEPAPRGGEDRAPSPLEYILVALCA